MDMLTLSVDVMILLAMVAVFAGFIDTLAGGGGLVTIPAMLMVGVPPLFALGTNKLQSCMGAGTASFNMLRRQVVQWEHVKWLMFAGFIGALFGTIAIQFVNTDALEYIIPTVIFIIMVYFLISPKPKDTHRVSDRTFKRYIVPSIGFYDGALGPGTGSFFTLAGVACKAQEIIQATAYAKTMNFATNIASLIVFVIAGKILWAVGLAMMVGQFIGAWLGSKCLLSVKPIVLRVLIVAVCFCMLVKYLFFS